jgi:GDP-L-fucose synthase
MNRTVLVTGATGMVGKNLVKSLLENGYFVLTPTRLQLDLTNAIDVLNYFRTNKIDLVIHAAGLVGGIQANMNRPHSFLSINSQIALNVINACIEQKIEKVINLGSSCMYPKDNNNELSEEMILTGPLEPTNEGYAIAKILAYKLCEYAEKEYNLKYKTIIPCNLYGEFDNFHPINSHMIPAVIRKVHNSKLYNSPVEIWGSGEARREFMYVGDLVDFIVWSIDKYNFLPKIVNVGLGYDYSINEYYNAVSNVIGYEGEFCYDLSKPEGMKRKLCSIEKQLALGWKAKTSLLEGIEKTYKFYLSNYAI